VAAIALVVREEETAIEREVCAVSFNTGLALAQRSWDWGPVCGERLDHRQVWCDGQPGRGGERTLSILFCIAPTNLSKWLPSTAKLPTSSINLPPPAWLELAALAARLLELDTRAVPRPREEVVLWA